ncbi:MAG: cysteine hydrolase [Ruminococcus sp.]|nr:cysteine hydrolase [Ruminococcus sp.]MDE6848077.1 cysteine hydrolase [Ruminococcus sp.]
MKVLIVIDMQNDFTTGILGNPETASVVKNVTEYIRKFRETESDGKIIATLDTHDENYMNTQEGKYLPVPHCIRGTDGWKLVPEIDKVLGEFIRLEKITFGAVDLPFVVGRDEKIEEIQIMGVCTDICVISNAMIIKSAFPEVPVRVIAECCAGVTPESHRTALDAMRACQIIVEE